MASSAIIASPPPPGDFACPTPLCLRTSTPSDPASHSSGARHTPTAMNSAHRQALATLWQERYATP
jgi:hypothetical protein